MIEGPGAAAMRNLRIPGIAPAPRGGAIRGRAPAGFNSS
jgi:hypothetical protein